jgi:phospholipid/cholesterol/gamma-HCH transport system permease protein
MEQIVFLNTQKKRVHCQGDWNLAHAAEIKKTLASTKLDASYTVVDGSDVDSLDSAGVMLLNTLVDRHGSKLPLENFSVQHLALIQLINACDIKPLAPLSIDTLLQKVGKQSSAKLDELRLYLALVGELAMDTLQAIRHPKLFRVRAWGKIIQTAGVDALFIIALLSCMIGIVMTYQMGLQLKTYGANIFIVNLLGLSILREFAPLITAIMVAGRTGSAFTAQLGIMKINQEIDALNTLGIKPSFLLLLPRVFGLMIALPLLTMWADVFGIIGGMIMSKNMLGIGWADFLDRFKDVISTRSLIIGLSKTPVFALIIASIACFQGLQVTGSADSVGRQTTKSVVWSIFFIIIADAVFSILFSKFKI